MIVSIIIWFVFGITMTYLIIIGIMTLGWYMILSISTSDNYSPGDVKVSILIAMRNEEDNIENLIKHIAKQDYSQNSYDVILVDDHSTDNTREVTEKLLTMYPELNINLISATGEGKKAAISDGVAFSDSELIVTTDSDCIMGHNWLSTIVEHYLSTGSYLMLGPVVYNKEKSFLQKLFSVEFASLVASGAGSMGAGLPLMGNGANLIFRREVYNKCKPEISKFASGDDVFLLHEVAKRFGAKSISFIKNEAAIVSTKAPVSFRAFLKQRIRWGSKAKGYRMLWPVIVSLSIFLFNLVLCIIFVSGLYYSWLLPVFLLLIITKYVVDIPLVFNYLTFSKRSGLKPLLLILEFIYPFYIVLTAVLALFMKFEWKGREKLN